MADENIWDEIIRLDFQIEMKILVFKKTWQNIFLINQQIEEALSRLDRLADVRHPRRAAVIRDEIAELVSRRQQLLSYVTTKHAEVMELSSRLDQLKGIGETSISRAVLDVKTSISRAVLDVKTLS